MFDEGGCGFEGGVKWERNEDLEARLKVVGVKEV